jgi:hypothetical protein
VAAAEGDVAVAEGDIARATESPIAAHTSAAVTIQPVRFDSNRRTLGQRACSATVTEAGS